MPAESALIANVLRRVVAGAMGACVLAATCAPSAAADLSRRHHRARHGKLAIYRGDRACPRYEPRDYRPRTVDDPLCYAVRPYGISMHLYDHSTLLDRVDDSPDEY